MLVMTLVYDELKGDLFKDINKLKEKFQKKNILIGLSENKISRLNMIKVYCNDEKINKRLINNTKYEVADIIYNRIINNYFDGGLEDYIYENYFFLKFEEIIDVKSYCLEALRCDGDIRNDDSIYCLSKKMGIIRTIAESLIEIEELNIDGFITFRMAIFKAEILDIVDNAIERYMAIKEYKEFIKLLRNFIEIQESKIEELNIMMKKNGDYLILDKKGKDIMKELKYDIDDSNLYNKINTEDVIISGLITTSPKKIIIHSIENAINKEFIETIKNIFEERVEVCNGCEMCKAYERK